MNLAEESLTAAIRRRLMRSAIIKDAKAWDELYSQLQTGMSNAWNDAMREGIAGALDRLRDLGPGAFTKQDGAAILRVLEGSVGAEAIRAAMREPVINLTDAIFRLGGEEVGQATGVAIAFMRPDLDALDVLKSGNLYWIGNSWNVRTQDTLAKVLDDYFQNGMTREGLAERMAQDLASVTQRSATYWEMLADHTATKTREIGRISGYERAGVTLVQVRAHLDQGTTEICRQMHGRIIPVSKMRGQANAYLAATARRDEVAAKGAWLMAGDDVDLTDVADADLPDNIATPPYHFRCRTITVAYFGTQSWRRADLPVVPSGSRKEVEAWAEEHIADRAEFNRALAAGKAARFTAALAQTRAHFDLGKLNRLASGALITRRGKDALAFYVDDYREMGINVGTFKQIDNPVTRRRGAVETGLDLDSVDFRWFAAEPTPEYIARHEYGHWFHDTYRAEVDRALAAAVEDDRGWPSMVSRYGQTNRDEWFAETFALYMEGEDQHYRIAPPVLTLLKEKDRFNDD